MDPIEAHLPVVGGVQYVDLNTNSTTEQAHVLTRLKTVPGAILLTVPVLPDDAPAPLPVLSALSPASGPHNTGFTLTVQGANFVSGCEINFGGKLRTTTFINSASLSCSLAKGDISKTGNYPVFVLSPRKNSSGTLLFAST